MKLNFWQWLGIVLLVVGLVLVITRRTNDEQPAPQGTPPADTTVAPDKAPSTAPAAEPVG